MKKTFTIILLILSGVLILDSLNAGEAMFMFLLAGVIPGTNSSLSGNATLALFGGLMGFVLARIVARFIILATTKRSAAASHPA